MFYRPANSQYIYFRLPPGTCSSSKAFFDPWVKILDHSSCFSTFFVLKIPYTAREGCIPLANNVVSFYFLLKLSKDEISNRLALKATFSHIIAHFISPIKLLSLRNTVGRDHQSSRMQKNCTISKFGRGLLLVHVVWIFPLIENPVSSLRKGQCDEKPKKMNTFFNFLDFKEQIILISELTYLYNRNKKLNI